MATFIKKIIPPGVYRARDAEGNRQTVEVTPERIRHWVDTFKRMSSKAKIPAPWRHDPEALPVALAATKDELNSFNNAGYWTDLWEGEDGALYGKIESADSTASRKIGRTVTEVSPLIKPAWEDGEGETYEDAILHIALVNHPVVPHQENFQPEQSEAIAASLCFSQSDLLHAPGVQMANDDENTDGPPPKPESSDNPPDAAQKKEPVNAAGVTVQQVVEKLRSIGLVLPEDTNVQNFLERVIVAITAIEGNDQEEEEDEELPDGAELEEGNIVMSQKIPQYDPYTGKKLSEDKITQLRAEALIKEGKAGVALSAENQALVDHAKTLIRKGYEERVNKLVPRYGKAYVDKKLRPLLEEVQFSLGDDGKPRPTAIDYVLEGLEEAKPSQLFGTAMGGLPEGATVESAPEYFGGYEEESDEDIKKQITAAGLHVHS